MRIHYRSRSRRCRLHLLRGRGNHRRRRSGRAERQHGDRIDVTLWIARRPHAEIDVRLGSVGDAARTDRADDGSLRDGRAPGHGDGTQVHERGRVAGRRLDRDRLAAGGHGARERHDACGRREHRRPARGAEIDAAVLPGRIRMRLVEREWAQDRTVHGPGPGLRTRDGKCARTDEQGGDSAHDLSSFVVKTENDTTVASRRRRCQY